MKSFFLTFTFLFIVTWGFAQNNNREFLVLFYNVENLFDTRNDSLTSDDEFTPQGDRYWTWKRFEKKLQHTSKVIIAAGGWHMSDLIGLCEVENKYVLERLLNDTPLKKYDYRIIHKQSPDDRGIDVALLYNPLTFYPLGYEYLPLKNKAGDTLKTREILYLSGIMGKDTLHLFVNHWPSRYSGVMETQELRAIAALRLKTQCDSLFSLNSKAKIVIMGDFNDQPSNKSIANVLNAKTLDSNISDTELYNLSSDWLKNGMRTLKYQSQWFVFDQIIVSGTLLNDSLNLHTIPNWSTVCQFPFLFEEDKTHGGEKLFRTYNGYKYNGGFSDHLPILLRLKNKVDE